MANDYTSLINGNENAGISLANEAVTIAEEQWVRNSRYKWSETYDDEQYSTIDEKKIITVDENQVNVAQEAYGQFIPFRIPRYYDKIDLARSTLSIHYVRKRPQGDSFVEEGEEVEPINVQYTSTELRFGWLVDGKVTSCAGDVDFEIIARGVNSLGQSYIWKSQPLKKGLHIIETLEPGEPIVISDDWMQELVENFAQVVADAQLNLDNFVDKDTFAYELSNYATNQELQAVEDNVPVDIDLYIDSDYKLYAFLTTSDGRKIQSNVLDLPIESMVASIAYDDATEELIITLTNGNTTRVPIGAIISGDLANYYTKEEVYTKIETDEKLKGYASVAHIELRLGDLGVNVDDEGNETQKTVVEYVAGAIATALTNYYNKNEVYTKEEVNAKIGDLGTYTPEGEEEPIAYTVAQRLEEIESEATAIDSRFGELGHHYDEEKEEWVANTVVDYVTKAIDEVDVTEQLQEYAKTTEVEARVGEIPTEKTIKEYVDETVAAKEVDLSAYYTKVETEEVIDTKLVPYVTTVTLNERIGREIVDEFGEPINLVDYID
jgi:hypothetical protein